jgi:hypothetical protein
MTPVGMIHTVKPKGIVRGAPGTKAPLRFEIWFRTSRRRGWIQHVRLKSTLRLGSSDSDSGIGVLACPSQDRRHGNAVGDFAARLVISAGTGLHSDACLCASAGGIEGRKKSVQRTLGAQECSRRVCRMRLQFQSVAGNRSGKPETSRTRSVRRRLTTNEKSERCFEITPQHADAALARVREQLAKVRTRPATVLNQALRKKVHSGNVSLVWLKIETAARTGGSLTRRPNHGCNGYRSSRNSVHDGLYFCTLNRSIHANGPEYFSSNAQASLPNVSFHCL